MSVINYQSFQDLDQVDSYYHHASNPISIWSQQPISSAISQLTSAPSSLLIPNNIGMNNFQQNQSQNHLHNQQQQQESFQYDNLNNFENLTYIKINENECNDLIQKDFVQSLFEQPTTSTAIKINTKQSSLQEIISCKDESIFCYAQDSGNDIQNDQTRSNSFQSENQICSASTIKTTNKMNGSSTYPSISEIKQNLEQNRQSLHEIVSPHPGMKHNSHQSDLHYQPTSTTSCSSASLCCPSATHTSTMNLEVRMDFRQEDHFQGQGVYYPQNLNHQPQDIQNPYHAESEYYSYSQGYQVPQKICLQGNNQNSLQAHSVEETAQQLPIKGYLESHDKQQISNFERHYEQSYQNSNPYKYQRNSQLQYANNSNQYYFERLSQQNTIAAEDASRTLPPAPLSHFADHHHTSVQQHSIPALQNNYEASYYNSQLQPPFSSLKSNESKPLELQNNTQASYQNSHYDQAHYAHYQEQHYQQPTKYPSYQYDPDTFFDYECNSEFENAHHHLHQNSNVHNFPRFTNEQQQHYQFPQYRINQGNEDLNAEINSKYPSHQNTVAYSSNASFSNALSNSSLLPILPSSHQNVTKINQNCCSTFQSKFIRNQNQQLIQDNQMIPMLHSYQPNTQPQQYKEINNQCQIPLEQLNGSTSPKQLIPLKRDSIDTIVSPDVSNDIKRKDSIIISIKKQKEEIILEDSQDDCQSSSSPVSSKHIAAASVRARAKTVNIICSPGPKKSASSVSLKLTPKNSPNPKKIQKRSVDITTSYYEDEEEKELRLKLESVKLDKKLSIDTQSLDDDEEEDGDEDLNESQDNNSSVNKELLMLTQNKKNVVKNIMSAFKTFVLSWGCKKAIEQIYNSANESCEEIDDIQRKFKRYIGSKSFNHYSLRLLILHVNYGPIFKFFLSKFSEEWLENSKIKDTESHQKMILFFLSCFDDIKIIDTLRRHPKKKCRFS